MKPITVVVPTCNRTETLRWVLLGLARQSVSPDRFDVVVVDDGSSRPVSNRIADLRRSLPITVIRRSQPGGRAGACNAGLRTVTSPLVVLLDDDIVPSREWLAEQLSFHERHPRRFYACAGRVTWGSRLKSSPLLRYLEHHGRYVQCSHHGDGEAFYDAFTGNTSFKTEFIMEVGAFDETITRYGQEDLELVSRLYRNGLVSKFSRRAEGLHLHEVDVDGLVALERGDAFSAAHFFFRYPDGRWSISADLALVALAECRAESGVAVRKLALTANGNVDDLPPDGGSHVRAYDDLVCRSRLAGLQDYMETREPRYGVLKEQIRVLRSEANSENAAAALSAQIAMCGEFLPGAAILLHAARRLAGPGVAIHGYHEILTRHPDLAWPRIELAQLLLQQSQTAEAETALAECDFSSTPQLRIAHMHTHVQLRAAQGRVAEAKKFLDDARQGDPEWPWNVTMNRECAQLYAAVGEPELARACVAQVLAIGDPPPRGLRGLLECLFWIAEFQLARRTKKDAAATYVDIVSLGRRYPAAFAGHECVTTSLLRLAELESAGSDDGEGYYRQALRNLLKRANKGPVDQYRIGSIYEQLGNLRRAAKSFELVLRAKDACDLRAGAHFHLGQIAARQRRFSEGAVHLRRCLASQPGHVKARQLFEKILPGF